MGMQPEPITQFFLFAECDLILNTTLSLIGGSKTADKSEKEQENLWPSTVSSAVHIRPESNRVDFLFMDAKVIAHPHT